MLGKDFLMMIMAPKLAMAQEKGLIIPNLGIFLNVFYWNASQTEPERTKGNRKIQGSQCGRPWGRALVKRIRSFAQVLNVDFFRKENDFILETTMGTRYQKVNSTKKAFTLLKTPSFLDPSLCLTPTCYDTDWLIFFPKSWHIRDKVESHLADCSSRYAGF